MITVGSACAETQIGNFIFHLSSFWVVADSWVGRNIRDHDSQGVVGWTGKQRAQACMRCMLVACRKFTRHGCRLLCALVSWSLHRGASPASSWVMYTGCFHPQLFMFRGHRAASSLAPIPRMPSLSWYVLLSFQEWLQPQHLHASFSHHFWLWKHPPTVIISFSILCLVHLCDLQLSFCCVLLYPYLLSPQLRTEWWYD